jgi:redox-sensitive bicupin YhaK (pirin superfamily)
MNARIIKSTDRGHADHGWLKAKHSFSFAGYYDPEKIHFGVLRVLNDDYVAPGAGFGMHPHDNMEIITIPLEGALEHRDNMGNRGVIRYGDVQVMSAGTGVMHSEYNASKTDPVKLFQIWLFPDQENVEPRYDQISLNIADRHNKFQLIVSPQSEKSGLWIHQQAWFSMGRFDRNFATDYKIRKNGNGVYAMVVSGQFNINGYDLDERDAIAISQTDTINILSKTDGAEILLMDIPMHQE